MITCFLSLLLRWLFIGFLQPVFPKQMARLVRLVTRAASGAVKNAAPDPASSSAPYRLYNIGSNNPVHLSRYIEVLEEQLGRTAIKNLLPIQPGDVPDTFANVDDLIEDVNYRPDTPIEKGIAEFVKWYLAYYHNEPADLEN